MITRESVSAEVGSDRADAARRNERLALWAFVAYLVVALPLLLWFGSYRWFFGDEWSFLADRSVTFHDLFRAHNQHWSTVPVLVYRGMYSLFGVRTYLPYQLLIVVLHLTTAALVRVVMRRAGVGPWIATVAAGAFVLLGSAEDNILWAFQIGFVGTIALGITQVILADHDGPIDRRDWIGLAVGAVALMTTGQAIALIFAAGLVCVFRRRWAAAVLHTVPLAVLYVAWFRLADVTPVVGIEDRPFTVGAYADWMWDAAVALFVGLGWFVPFALALLALLVGGTIVAWRSEGTSVFLRRTAAPCALLVAAFVAMSLAAPSRFFLGTEPARAGRYVGVMAALSLPAIAVAADAVVRRWHRLWPVVFALFLVPAPFNAIAFGDDPFLSPGYFDQQRAYVSGLAESPLAARVPPWVQPNNSILGQPDMTIGWLLDARRRGELPPPEPLSTSTEQRLVLQLGVSEVEDGEEPEGLQCTTQTTPLAVDPRVGEVWVLETPARVSRWSGAQPSGQGRGLEASVVQITLPDLHLLITPASGEDVFELCR